MAFMSVMNVGKLLTRTALLFQVGSTASLLTGFSEFNMMHSELNILRMLCQCQHGDFYQLSVTFTGFTILVSQQHHLLLLYIVYHKPKHWKILPCL